MKPQPRQKLEYEKCRTDDWTQGIIEDIQRDEKRSTGYKDEETGDPIIRDSVRFKFKIDGLNYPHYSHWMSFSYHEKSNLLKKYVMSLVEGAQPDMDFDLESLKGMKVKIMWQDKGEYQNIEMIRPIGAKLDPTIPF